MKIKEVRLKNFKSYKDEKIILSTSSEKNVTLIFGAMGAGKSSLFQAINWCLYGDLVEGRGNTIADMNDIAGKYLLDELDEHDTGEVTIEIDFEHEGYDYFLSRTAFFVKEGCKLIYKKRNDAVTLNITSNSSDPRTYDKDQASTINRLVTAILPFSAREYFLFDGEKLDSFSKIDQKKEIKNAIKEVLGLTDLEYAREHLQLIEKNLRRKYSDLENSDEINTINKAIEENDSKISEIASRINELNKQLDDAQLDYKENEEELNSFQKEQDNIRRRGELMKKRDENIESLKERRKALRDLLTTAYISYGRNILNDSIGLLGKWQKEGKFPAEYYNKDFIDNILRNMKCFFWKFEKNSKEHNFFLKEAERLKSWNRNIQDELTQIFADLKKEDQKAEVLYRDIKREHGDFVLIQDSIEGIKQELSELNKIITSKITDEDMKRCNELHTELDGRIRKLKNDIFLKEQNKDRLEEFGKRFSKLLSSEKAKTNEGKKVKKKWDIVKDSIISLNLLYDEFTNEKRIEIEKLTSELFKALFWKKSHFTNVKLNKDYKLIIFDKWDEEGRKTFSAGEREVLSLSFVTALAKSASRNAPFLIDTPFARISKEPTDNISENLPQQLSQLILFVTDKELTKNAEEAFLKKCDNVWTLMFNEKTSRTEIREGKHVK